MKRIDSARHMAVHLLGEFETREASLEHHLKCLQDSALTPLDRRFVRHLVLGTVRWRKRLDWIVDQFARRPISSCSPWIRQILRLGVYQIFWLDRIPDRAAVHTSVELARHFGHGGVVSLVNAILRQILRRADTIQYPSRHEDLSAHLAVYYSHPRWLVERWLKNWGEDATEALLKADNKEAPLYIRANPLRVNEDKLAANLQPTFQALHPVGPLPGYFNIEEPEGLFNSQAYQAGFFQVQDISAGLAVALLDPHPGERILDLCSAPGGKTTQMAIAMQDQGLIVAADRSLKRLQLVRENALRLRLQSIRPVVQDARTRGTGQFARILADVPCSGTGILRRHPEARWRKQATQLSGLVELQYSILQRAFARLRSGGVLVYSTCSLEKEENDALIERFLNANGTAVLEPASDYFPGQPWAGRFIQTLPGRDPGDGGFAARIRKRIL